MTCNLEFLGGFSSIKLQDDDGLLLFSLGLRLYDPKVGSLWSDLDILLRNTRKKWKFWEEEGKIYLEAWVEIRRIEERMKWKKEMEGLGFNGLAEFLRTWRGEFDDFYTKLEGWKRVWLVDLGGNLNFVESR